jgi:hypothetical protein
MYSPEWAVLNGMLGVRMIERADQIETGARAGAEDIDTLHPMPERKRWRTPAVILSQIFANGTVHGSRETTLGGGGTLPSS